MWKRYFAKFVDVKSESSDVAFLKNKNKATRKLQAFIEKVKIKFGQEKLFEK